MARGSKVSYNDKQKRKAAHIEESEEKRGRAWANGRKKAGRKTTRKTTSHSSRRAA